ncbi:MAG: hypothetical protein ACUVUE_04825 [Candidatus Bathycorpusculaceae bacterium]
MPSQKRREIDDAVQFLRSHGPSTFQSLLTALAIWLFSVLVFIPLANALNWQTGLLCSLIAFTAFTVFMYRTVVGFKRLIDTFSFLPARKYSSKWGISQSDALTLFKYAFYILFALFVYALYYPFLTGFHFAVSGIVLIVIVIWVFFLALRIFSILSAKILEKLMLD